MKTLLVIDMLNDFIDEKGALYCGQTARDIIPFIKNRISEYQKEGNTIIFLQDSHAEDDLEFQKFPVHGVTGTWGCTTIPELNVDLVDISHIIPKRRYSGFHGTILASLLRHINPEKVEVVGVCTSICVMDTVGGLANRDYKVVVPRAGVADFNPDNHANALNRIRDLYGAKIV